jgi:hypothetical protein
MREEAETENFMDEKAEVVKKISLKHGGGGAM